MITGIGRRRIAVPVLLLAAAALFTAGSPAHAATAAAGATVAVTPSVQTPAVGCFRVPVTVTVTGAKYWNAFIDSSSAMTDIHMAGDRSTQTDAIYHCPYRDGVGTFAVKSTVSLYDAKYHFLGTRTSTSQYTVVKTKPEVGINIRSGAPKVGQPVVLRMCTAVATVPLVQQAITLNMVPSSGTAQAFSFTTLRSGCAVYVGYFTRAAKVKVTFSTVVTPNLAPSTTPPLTLNVTK